eukprot:352648-Chlamydomonas_euryale.AAC.2
MEGRGGACERAVAHGVSGSLLNGCPTALAILQSRPGQRACHLHVPHKDRPPPLSTLPAPLLRVCEWPQQAAHPRVRAVQRSGRANRSGFARHVYLHEVPVLVGAFACAHLSRPVSPARARPSPRPEASCPPCCHAQLSV